LDIKQETRLLKVAFSHTISANGNVMAPAMRIYAVDKKSYGGIVK